MTHDLNDPTSPSNPPAPTPSQWTGAALDSIDRELSFYRRRSGQIYLVALSVEALIIVGRENIQLPSTLAMWTTPLVLTVLFLGVAIVGTVLGAEYRRRIHELKDTRNELVKADLRLCVYPTERRVSEIQVLYFVLWFTSLGSSAISWIRTYPDEAALKVVAVVYVVAALVVGIYGMWISFRKTRSGVSKSSAGRCGRNAK